MSWVPMHTYEATYNMLTVDTVLHCSDTTLLVLQLHAVKVCHCCEQDLIPSVMPCLVGKPCLQATSISRSSGLANPLMHLLFSLMSYRLT